VAGVIAKPFEPVMLSQQILRAIGQGLPHTEEEITPPLDQNHLREKSRQNPLRET
jgi:hypothetical protein